MWSSRSPTQLNQLLSTSKSLVSLILTPWLEFQTEWQWDTTLAVALSQLHVAFQIVSYPLWPHLKRQQSLINLSLLQLSPPRTIVTTISWVQVMGTLLSPLQLVPISPNMEDSSLLVSQAGTETELLQFSIMPPESPNVHPLKSLSLSRNLLTLFILSSSKIMVARQQLPLNVATTIILFISRLSPVSRRLLLIRRVSRTRSWHTQLGPLMPTLWFLVL